MIVLADHAQTPVSRGLPLADLLGREWTVLAPSDDRPELAQLAVSPTGRAAHVYLLPGEGERADRDEVRRRLGETEGVDLVCWREGSDRGRGAGWGAAAVPARRPGHRSARRALGSSTATPECPERGRSRTSHFAAPSTRTPSPVSSLRVTAPHAGDFIVSLTPGYEAVDWGGVSHAGGGSHGSLHAGDSLGPLLFVGCGPEHPG